MTWDKNIADEGTYHVRDVMLELEALYPGVNTGLLHKFLSDVVVDIEQRIPRLAHPDSFSKNHRRALVRVSKELYEEHLNMIEAGVAMKVYREPATGTYDLALHAQWAAAYTSLINKAIMNY